MVASTGAASAVTSLIKNGGFEKPVVPVGSFDLFSTGQTFSGWHVVGATGSVAPISGQFTSNGFTFDAKSGAQWLDLTGMSNTATGVAQTVPTSAGTTYHLTFWVGNIYDPQGPFGVSSTVKVFVNNVLKLTAVNSMQSASSQTWKMFTLSIKATSSQTKIAFINGDPSSDNTNGLDQVSLS